MGKAYSYSSSYPTTHQEAPSVTACSATYETSSTSPTVACENSTSQTGIPSPWSFWQQRSSVAIGYQQLRCYSIYCAEGMCCHRNSSSSKQKFDFLTSIWTPWKQFCLPNIVVKDISFTSKGLLVNFVGSFMFLSRMYLEPLWLILQPLRSMFMKVHERSKTH